MSEIDRRAFFMVCLTAPLAACAVQSVSKGIAPAQLSFQNPGSWKTIVGGTRVFVVSGPIKT